MQNATEPRGQEKGAILYIVGASLFVLLGFLGLAFDLGHMYNNKSQLQNMADAAALSGATALNGTAAGIDLATLRARDSNSRLANKTEFNNAGVTLAEANVSFSTTLNGNYESRSVARTNPTDVKFVRVVVPPQTTEIFFAKVIPGIPNSSTFGAEAVAGQTPVTKACSGLDPFSPAPIPLNNTSDPNFGYIEDQIYEVRLAPGNSGKGCSDYGLPGSVTGNFGLASPAGCGPSTTCFEDTILNNATGPCITIGGSLPTDTGNGGNAVLGIIQQRFNQDTDTNPYPNYDAYVNANLGNNRRRIRVAFNNGVIPNGNHPYTVAGFGCFFMNVIPDPHPPSSAICMQYIGTCDTGPGGETVGNSASLTKIVLFR
jgi:Flp pilus assembly protein TadG